MRAKAKVLSPSQYGKLAKLTLADSVQLEKLGDVLLRGSRRSHGCLTREIESKLARRERPHRDVYVYSRLRHRQVG